MEQSNIMRIICAACLPFFSIPGPQLPKPCFLLDMDNIGVAVQDKEPAGRRINDLFFYEGRLYIGTGDAVINTGPAPIVYYDPEEDTFITQFTVDDEAIYLYQTIGERLAIPGVDATEDWTLGNFYVLSDTGWMKYRTIPHALHVNCLALFNDRLYASAGAFGSVGDSIEHYFGAVFVSSDSGITWSLSYTTSSDEISVYRINALTRYNDKLYAFPYAYSAIEKHDIPKDHHEGLSDEPYDNDRYLILRDALFGNSDVFTFDGSSWRYEDIIPENRLCLTGRPVLFKGTLLIPTVSGQYIDYLALPSKKPAQATTRLYAYDGNKSTAIDLKYDRLIDMIAGDGTVFVLFQFDKTYYIAETVDLKHWRYYAIPQSIEHPRALEINDEYFYIGAQDGTLYRASPGPRVQNRTDIDNP